MKERWKKISTGLIVVFLSVAGLWEYMQLYLYFDLPQAIVILPMIGAIAQIILKKFGWIVPVLTAVISVVYQLVEKRSSCVGIVELSRAKVLLSILPVMNWRRCLDTGTAKSQKIIGSWNPILCDWSGCDLRKRPSYVSKSHLSVCGEAADKQVRIQI